MMRAEPNPTFAMKNTDLKSLSPSGAAAFVELPCTYGRKCIPGARALVGMAACYVEVTPRRQTTTEPGEIGHFHCQMTEVYCFTRGRGSMFLNGVWKPIRPGDLAIIPPGCVHNTEASEDGLDFLVWTQPAFNSADSFDVFEWPPRCENAAATPGFIHAPARHDTPGARISEIWESDDFAVCSAALPAGFAIPTHAHTASEEFYFILSGEGIISLAGSESPVRAGTLVAIPVGVRHNIAATKALHYLVAATPPISDRYLPVCGTADDGLTTSTPLAGERA